MNALLLVSALAVAQAAPHDHQHQHSEQIGRVSFQTSCSPQAHAIFERGVTWLHSFEYEQAEAAFNEAAAADPSCSIAHWGAAMSLYHPLWASVPLPAAALVPRASALREQPSGE